MNVHKPVIFTLVSLLALASQVAQAATAVACRDVRIFTERSSDEFVRITPREDGKKARFEMCDYDHPTICRTLGRSQSYDIQYLGGKKFMEYFKAGTLLVFDAEASVLAGAVLGFVGLIPLGGAATGTAAAEAYVALGGMNGTYLASAGLAGGATGFLLMATNFFNPMNHFYDGAMIRDLRDAVQNGSCAISFEFDKKELRERMESMTEHLDAVE